jgi:hypothetical protein
VPRFKTGSGAAAGSWWVGARGEGRRMEDRGERARRRAEEGGRRKGPDLTAFGEIERTKPNRSRWQELCNTLWQLNLNPRIRKNWHLTTTAGQLSVVKLRRAQSSRCRLLRASGARRSPPGDDRVAAQHRGAVARRAEPAIATGGTLRGGERRSRAFVYRPRSSKVRSTLLASACVLYILLK